MEFDLSSLGILEVDLRGVVTTVSKYDIDENSKGGFLWLTKPNKGQNSNILGDQIIKVTMPFEMFQECQVAEVSGKFTFPGVFEVKASVISGSANKSGHKAISIKQLARLRVTAEAIGDSTTNPPPGSSTANLPADSSTVSPPVSNPKPK